MSRPPDADRPGAALALFGLPPAGAWLWLVRSGPNEAAATIGPVLFHPLPGVLVAISQEIAGRG